MTEIISIRGPIEKIDGQLVLMIPLDAGGKELVECSRGIGQVEGEFLKVIIPEWLAGTLRIDSGSKVHVDNENGKFNIHGINPQPIQ